MVPALLNCVDSVWIPLFVCCARMWVYMAQHPVREVKLHSAGNEARSAPKLGLKRNAFFLSWKFEISQTKRILTKFRSCNFIPSWNRPYIFVFAKKTRLFLFLQKKLRNHWSLSVFLTIFAKNIKLLQKNWTFCQAVSRFRFCVAHIFAKSPENKYYPRYWRVHR
jgi:hypothetical protein